MNIELSRYLFFKLVEHFENIKKDAEKTITKYQNDENITQWDKERLNEATEDFKLAEVLLLAFYEGDDK